MGTAETIEAARRQRSRDSSTGNDLDEITARRCRRRMPQSAL